MRRTLFGVEPRETNRCVFVLVILCDLLLPLPNLSLVFLLAIDFELAPKVIRVD
jgi:flagellar biosynthesis component FlhA